MEFNEFKEKAIKVLNLNLNGYKIKRVKRRTDSLMKRHNIDNYQECLTKITNDVNFRSTYLNHLTINTTEFFRNPKNFTYLKEEIFPELLDKYNKIKIWSAPCANGAEPYTLAIILQELGVNPRKYEILASDIDSEILNTARQGIYDKKALKNAPQGTISKYFKKAKGENNKYEIKNSVKQQVHFEEKDLIKGSYQKKWHLILCRNFFIYLTRDLKDKLTQKFVDSLYDNTLLFLGNTEFIFNPQKYGLKKEQMSFYRKES
ncbi:MAG: CheR family methyltransferase [Halanaerobiaceae bacterium]